MLFAPRVPVVLPQGGDFLYLDSPVVRDTLAQLGRGESVPAAAWNAVQAAYAFTLDAVSRPPFPDGGLAVVVGADGVAQPGQLGRAFVGGDAVVSLGASAPSAGLTGQGPGGCLPAPDWMRAPPTSGLLPGGCFPPVAERPSGCVGCFPGARPSGDPADSGVGALLGGRTVMMSAADRHVVWRDMQAVLFSMREQAVLVPAQGPRPTSGLGPIAIGAIVAAGVAAFGAIGYVFRQQELDAEVRLHGQDVAAQLDLQNAEGYRRAWLERYRAGLEHCRRMGQANCTITIGNDLAPPTPTLPGIVNRPSALDEALRRMSEAAAQGVTYASLGLVGVAGVAVAGNMALSAFERHQLRGKLGG